MWNKGAKCAGTRQVMQPPPHPAKVVEAQSTSTGNAMVIDKPAKPVAGPSKHPDDTDVIDGELIY